MINYKNFSEYAGIWFSIRFWREIYLTKTEGVNKKGQFLATKKFSPKCYSKCRSICLKNKSGKKRYSNEHFIFEYCRIRKIVCLHFVVVAWEVLPIVFEERCAFQLACSLLFALFPFYDEFFLHRWRQCSPCKWPRIALKRIWTYSSCWELKLCLQKQLKCFVWISTRKFSFYSVYRINIAPLCLKKISIWEHYEISDYTIGTFRSIIPAIQQPYDQQAVW